MQKHNIHFVLLVFSAVLVSACCKPAEFPYSPDRSFAIAAAASNEDGIAAGNFGARYTLAPSMRTFAMLLEYDDSTAELTLMQIADTINLSLPTGPDDQYDTLRTTLSGRSGNAFDLLWLQDQSAVLHKITQLYENELTNGQSSTLQRYAQNRLPAIRQQQQTADSLFNLQSLK